ncbi:MAG: hypothetical protein K1X65_16915 [Caldilineales bacterium]|nr:hypothetical protein [Caldilineales bacterium]MCW5858328.1 hypothetical protein [Caldilineales bacterium]
MSQLRSTTWQGLSAWTLENAVTGVVIVPEMGAKIASLCDRRNGYEWIVGPIPGRAVRQATYGAPFAEQDMAGWDEMFPTIIACAYPGAGPHHGVHLPDHGEAWALPWEVVKATGSELTLRLRGQVLPYRLTRTASLVAPTVFRLDYRLENLGDEAMPYLWAAHPQFVIGPDGYVIFPPEVVTVINTIPPTWGWGEAETRFDWPEALAPDGSHKRLDTVGPASAGQGRKFYALADVHPAWAAVWSRSSGNWLRLEWDPARLPYLGVWTDEGAVHCEAVVSPQPTTGWYDDLSLAWRKGRVNIVPGESEQCWRLDVHLGIDGDPLPPHPREATP